MRASLRGRESLLQSIIAFAWGWLSWFVSLLLAGIGHWGEYSNATKFVRMKAWAPNSRAVYAFAILAALIGSVAAFHQMRVQLLEENLRLSSIVKSIGSPRLTPLDAEPDISYDDQMQEARVQIKFAFKNQGKRPAHNVILKGGLTPASNLSGFHIDLIDEFVNPVDSGSEIETFVNAKSNYAVRNNGSR